MGSATISLRYDEGSNKVVVVCEGPDDGSGNRWQFVESFRPSSVPSALYGFAAGWAMVVTGQWS